MQLRHQPPFNRGLTILSPRSGASADMLMDFGALVLGPGETWKDASDTDERAWLLSRGAANLRWDGGEQFVSRPDLFDSCPWCLSLPAGNGLVVTAGADGAEFYWCATDNPKPMAPKIYSPDQCRSELRGKGTLRETSTRIVRTIFDDGNRPESNLVIGEVIGVPGKWSSYPPHHHPQPEIYHYRFSPQQGFGLTAIGDTPYIIRDRDTIQIRDGQDHPQVAAPGYAMWYLWAIRHIEGARYGPQHVAKEHQWVVGPEENIWRPDETKFS
jgi:5-deoxy-glucuronate isomerase